MPQSRGGLANVLFNNLFNGRKNRKLDNDSVNGSVNEYNDDEDDNEYDEYKSNSEGEVLFPEQLPPTATANDVVKAWAAKLHFVYLQTVPNEEDFNRGNEDSSTIDGYDDASSIADSDQHRQQLPNANIQFNYTKHYPKANRTTQSVSSLSTYNQKRPTNSSVLPSTVQTTVSSLSGLLNFLFTELNDHCLLMTIGLKSKGVQLTYGAGKIDWRLELKRFYLSIKLPNKLSSIDEILAKYSGREDQILPALSVKYKKIIPPSLQDHIESLQQLLETQTESSFIAAAPPNVIRSTSQQAQPNNRSPVLSGSSSNMNYNGRIKQPISSTARVTK